MARASAYGVLLVTGGKTHQELYAESFRAEGRAKLVAVTDEPTVSPERRRQNERFAQQFGLPYVENLDEALDRQDYQIICICTEPERRARVIRRCLQSGRALYLDKSLCPRLQDADTLAAEAQRAHVLTHMYSNITQPWAQRARWVVESGRLGRLIAIHADTFFAKGHPNRPELRRRKETDSPHPESYQMKDAKRELDNIGVYPLTLICWLAQQKVKSVFATTGNYFFQEYLRRDVEDFASVAGRLEDGTLFSISCGRIGWTSHPASAHNRVILVGTRGVAIVDANAPRLYLAMPEAAAWTPPGTDPEDPMAFWPSTQQALAVRPKEAWLPLESDPLADARYFLDCVEANRPSEMSIVEAAHATEVILAAYRSAARGEPVSLPLARGG
jgi:UDP-N-acetyl-2-amino-2-deoxyglucuronate dehydrogenase